jgi:hypothetical protein
MTTPVNTDQTVLTAQMNRAKAMIDRINSQIKALKAPDKAKNPAGYSNYQKTLAALQKNLKVQTDLMGTLQTRQNQIYADTGQYEKLLTGENRDAFLALNSVFKQYGLETLAGKIYEYVKNGYSADTISILLQDTAEYKTRFAGNEARKQAGLPVLSPGEYLSTEASYRQIMQSAGMPVGFYDQHSDFAGWIGMNVSPSEIQNRVDLATQATVLANPNYRKALNMIGISDNEMTAYFLDPQKSLPILQKSAATAQIGGAALSQGLTFDKSYAEQLALSGITQDQAQSGYSQVATELDTMRALGAIYGQEWDQRTSEEAIFQGSGEAIQKKSRLLSQERGAFGSATGGAKSGLSQGGGAR